MGLMGIQLRIALKNEMPSEFELIESTTETNSNTVMQSNQNAEQEIDQNTPEEVSTQKTNVEKNIQNLKKPYLKQNPKTKDIKDKMVKESIPKEKREGVKE
jgi:hypothetical protein